SVLIGPLHGQAKEKQYRRPNVHHEPFKGGIQMITEVVISEDIDRKVTVQYERNDCTPAYPTHVPRDSAIHSTDNYQRQQWEKWIQSPKNKGPPNGDERLQDRCVSVPVQHFRQKLCVPSLAYEIGRRNEPDLEEQTRSKRREKSDEVQAKLPQGALALP